MRPITAVLASPLYLLRPKPIPASPSGAVTTKRPDAAAHLREQRPAPAKS